MKGDFNTDREPPAPLSLADLPPGGECVVVAVEQGRPAGRRLLDLGMLPNTPVKVLRRAPLGDPVVYDLRGYQLCLRRQDAALVRIHASGAESPTKPRG